MAHRLNAAVETLMREAAAKLIMPRFQALAPEDVGQKAEEAIVTVVDHEVERALSRGLSRLSPTARIIAEEACAADPALLDDIGRGSAWLIDPLDGTRNFAAGQRPFAVLVALAREGEVCAGWSLDPVSGRMCHAVRRGGAFVDGRRVAADGTGSDRIVAALGTRYFPEPLRSQIDSRASSRMTLAPLPLCVGEQYVRLGLGQNDVALFWRAQPWDHAAGALWLTEAGGKVAHLDGRRYSLRSKQRGLLAAATPALWEQAALSLLG